MKRSNRIAWLGAIALSVIILLTLFAAPTTKIYNGSTYSRAPSGYGAWYAFMQDQGINIQRWQKPFSDLNGKSPVTFLRVNFYPTEPSLSSYEQDWIEKGNTLVILGVQARVSEANFSTLQTSPVGDVKIETRRRDQKAKQPQIVLGDRFGAVVWEKKYNQGKVIFSTTPYLAANAYQDNLNNFQFLAKLVNQNGNKLLVDEYIHGYIDADVRKSEGSKDLFSYLAKTPLLPMLAQLGVLLLVLIWAQNRRFGKPVPLATPVVDNSEAYIQALAGVLEKAKSSDFVLQMIGKEEQLQLQKALGLGEVLLDRQTLVNIWVEKTGASATELDSVLKLQASKQPINERDLLNWLRKWRTLRGLKI